MPRPKKNKEITEKQVLEYVEIEEEIKTLKSNLDALETDKKAREVILFEALSNGAPTTHLSFELTAKTSERRYPAWKEWFVQYAGEKKAEQILKKTTPIVYHNVLARRKMKIVPA